VETGVTIAPRSISGTIAHHKHLDAFSGIVGRGEGVLIFRFRPAHPRDQHRSNTNMLRGESHEMARKVQSALNGNDSRNRPAYLGQVRLAL